MPENNVVEFPSQITSEQEPSVEAETTDQASMPRPNFQAMTKLLRQTKQLITYFQESWDEAKAEFEITDDQMAKLIEYNNSARVPKQEDSEEEYDDLNGLDAIPMEKVAEIFGDHSKIFGVDHTQTIDRVRHAANVFTELFKAHRSYREAEQFFNEAMDASEQASIETLRYVAENDEDPEKREKAKANLDKYLNTKYLAFLTEFDEAVEGRLLKAFFDQARIKYILERARRQMDRLKIPEMFILEISGFEKRFLPEKYHRQNNLLLLAFLQLVSYGRPMDNEPVRRQAKAMVLTLDRFVRKTLPPEDLEKVTANIITFEDRFLGPISERLASDDTNSGAAATDQL